MGWQYGFELSTTFVRHGGVERTRKAVMEIMADLLRRDGVEATGGELYGVAERVIHGKNGCSVKTDKSGCLNFVVPETALGKTLVAKLKAAEERRALLAAQDAQMKALMKDQVSRPFRQYAPEGAATDLVEKKLSEAIALDTAMRQEALGQICEGW